jgi:hypothetical protein
MSYPTTGTSAPVHFPESTRSSLDPYEAAGSPSPFQRAAQAIEDYARSEPWVFAGWVFGIGFVLGWKLKPW